MTDAGLFVVKWSNWGKHRLYVNTADDQRVGWLDLDTGESSLDMVELAAAFEAALREAEAIGDREGYSPRRTHSEPTVDLADRRPGQHLEEHIAATLEAGRELEPAHPDFQGRHAYSSWELGILGEQRVADELDRLVDLDRRWTFLNSIPVGTHTSDIDQLVVGPGGVFTVNAKHHHGGHVWVGGDALSVNGSWTHYVADSRREASRARNLLTAAVGSDVAVTGVVVLVGVARLTIKAQPADVRVLDGAELVDFLRSQPTILGADAAAPALSAARLSCTWR